MKVSLFVTVTALCKEKPETLTRVLYFIVISVFCVFYFVPQQNACKYSSRLFN